MLDGRYNRYRYNRYRYNRYLQRQAAMLDGLLDVPALLPALLRQVRLGQVQVRPRPICTQFSVKRVNQWA